MSKFKDFFSYNEISKDMWRKKFREAAGKFKVSFDLENDDSVTQREIVVDQSFWDHTQCKFRCELRCGCGDWETPTYYFRCQIIKGYSKGNSTYNDPHFCVIPDKNGGNSHLIRGKKGWISPDNDHSDKDMEKPSEKKCWEFLKDHLKEKVQQEIENIKKERSHDDSGNAEADSGSF